MGKQQIGQLQPYELVVAIMIADLVAVPMQNKGIPLLTGIIPIFTLLISQLFLSYISMKSLRGREMICGKPTVLIDKGKILTKELQKERYNINDLLEELRVMGYPNIADVEYAILETNGCLSVIPKVDKRPVTPNDLNIKPQYEGLPLPIIIDGNIIHQNMKIANVDMKWLNDQLKMWNVNNIENVILASLDPNKVLTVYKKE
ncbi:membrane protein [Thermoanaerobacterium thermosaccharolyticum]|nr:membrane protein [Thermoanaerobacterium thermosaccharolyticum]